MPPQGFGERFYLYLKTSAYVDLSNFIGELRNLLGLGKFKDSEEFAALAASIATFLYSSFKGLTSFQKDDIRFFPYRMYCYGSCTGSEQNAFNAFSERLRELGDVEIHLTVRKEGEKEKGVDIQLATDMLIHAAWDHYDVAILVTGDADFAPAIRRVRDLGKKVYILFFKGFVAEELERVADGTIPIPTSVERMYLLGKIIKEHFQEQFRRQIVSMLGELRSNENIAQLVDNLINRIEGGDSMTTDDIAELRKCITSTVMSKKQHLRFMTRLLLYEGIIKA